MKDTTPGDPWANSILAARNEIATARAGDSYAGRAILQQSAIGLRCLVDRGEMPDPYRMACLAALLESLDAICAGTEPVDALYLRNPGHCPADPDLPVRNAILFFQVGAEADRLAARGHTRSDKPIDMAIRKVAANNRLTFDVVQSAWGGGGASKGWSLKKHHLKA